MQSNKNDVKKCCNYFSGIHASQHHSGVSLALEGDQVSVISIHLNILKFLWNIRRFCDQFSKFLIESKMESYNVSSPRPLDDLGSFRLFVRNLHNCGKLDKTELKMVFSRWTERFQVYFYHAQIRARSVARAAWMNTHTMQKNMVCFAWFEPSKIPLEDQKFLVSIRIAWIFRYFKTAELPYSRENRFPLRNCSENIFLNPELYVSEQWAISNNSELETSSVSTTVFWETYFKLSNYLAIDVNQSGNISAAGKVWSYPSRFSAPLAHLYPLHRSFL